MAKILVALGGNAIQSGKVFLPEDQKTACAATASILVDLIETGHQIAVVHGNGPQVGEIATDIELAHKVDNSHTTFPLDFYVAFTQGYIGYLLQQSLRNELHRKKIRREVLTIVTQAIVNPNDPAFDTPSKPIGMFYDESTAKKIAQQEHCNVKEDSGRGWRKVVASPQPIDIVEKDIIRQLFDHNHLLICCGGGGIPVITDEKGYQGIGAVIDKDLTASLLAGILAVDILLILTTVDYVFINFNQPNQQQINLMDVPMARQYITEGQFAKGSMLPKIQAAIKFIESKPDGKAIITSLANAVNGVYGQAGTMINAQGR